MPWALIAVACVVVLIVVVVVVVRHDMPVEYRAISELFWLIWCYFYTIRWRVRFRLRTAAGQTAGGFLFFGSFYVLLDFILTLYRAVNSDAPTSLIRIPHLPVLPLWVELLLIALAILVLRHHWREWNIKTREAHIPKSLKALIDQCRPFIRKRDLNYSETGELFSIVMQEMQAVLKVGRKGQELVFSIVRHEGGGDRLKTMHIHPPESPRVDPTEDLSLAESAAGKCMQTRVPIYVPSIKHRGGINMKTYQSVGLIYQKTKTEPGRSLMCVPICDEGTVCAVLNIASSRRNAFGPIDFAIIDLAAALLGDD